MDFKKSLFSELDGKYVLMLKEETDVPFSNESIIDYQTFVKKNNSYHNRIDSEFRKFNKAVSKINDRRYNRIFLEKKHREARREHRLKRLKFLFYWSSVIVLIGINLIFVIPSLITFREEVFFVPWETLWPAWLSTIIMMILLSVTSKIAENISEECATLGLLNMFLGILSILITGVALAWFISPIGGLFFSAVIYIVPVCVGGFIGLIIMGDSL